MVTNPNTAPVAVISGATSGVTGTAVSFAGTGSTDAEGPIASYAWTFGDGSSGNGATVNKTYAAAGTFTVTLTVADSGGLTNSSTRSVTITVPNTAPVAVISGATAGLTGVVLSFSGSGSTDAEGPIASYAWTFGDGTSGSGAAVSKTYAAAGTFTVTLTVTDSGGLTNSSTRAVTITVPNTAPVAVIGGATGGLTGASLSFSGSGSTDAEGPIASYAWTFGDGTSGSGATVNKTYAAAGTFTVTLTVTDSGGLTNSSTRAVTITVPGVGSGTTTVWIDDAVPVGSFKGGDADGWNWVSSNPTPYAGSLALRSAVTAGVHQHYFVGGNPTFPISAGDTLFAYVYLDPASPPREVMLQWYAGSWNFRAYWGENLISSGTDGTASRR